MNQIVTCPDCGHTFKIEILKGKRNTNRDQYFEKYEWIVARLTNGEMTDRGTMDIDVIGEPDGTTYQVKSSSYEKRDKHTRNTRWRFVFKRYEIEADFVVLFYVADGKNLIFLLPAAKVQKHLERSLNIYFFCVSNRIKNWIWDYHVTEDNFLKRVIELKRSHQLALQFTQGLGD